MVLDLRLGGAKVILVNVADGNDLGVGVTKDLIEVPARPVIPAADVPVDDTVARRRGAVETQSGRRQDIRRSHGARGGSRRSLKERTPGKAQSFRHDDILQGGKRSRHRTIFQTAFQHVASFARAHRNGSISARQPTSPSTS